MFSDDVLEFGQRSSNMLDQLGLPLPKRAANDLEFPEDLSEIANEDLAMHLSYWSSMCSYAQQKVAVLEGTYVISKEKTEQEYDIRLYTAIKKGMKITEARAIVNASKIVRDMKTSVSTIEADLKVLKAVLSGYELKNHAISREITRRSNERNIRDG